MTTYTTTLRERRDLAEGTSAFHFAKPAGFTFKPGQAIELLIPDPAGGDDMGHAFSIVSAPFEDELVVATRMRDSAYKRALGALKPGASVRIDGPFGSLTLHKNPARAAVLIAGGIGITPFMSMVRHAAHEPLDHRIALLYSNRRPEDAAYFDELVGLGKSHDKFRLVATMTDMAKSARSWLGDRRFIDGPFIKSAIDGLDNPIFYVAGPPALVEAAKQALAQAGVDEDDIRSEEFFGYETAALKDEAHSAEAA
jgi:ferredoxin-NADP reductase